jgi:hypothetical protein
MLLLPYLLSYLVPLWIFCWRFSAWALFQSIVSDNSYLLFLLRGMPFYFSWRDTAICSFLG